jgi:YVTN family beta-propeller protein/VCBS repeat-containing protein
VQSTGGAQNDSGTGLTAPVLPSDSPFSRKLSTTSEQPTVAPKPLSALGSSSPAAGLDGLQNTMRFAAQSVTDAPSLSAPSSTVLARTQPQQQNVVSLPASPNVDAVEAQSVPAALSGPLAPTNMASTVVASVLSVMGLNSLTGTGPGVPADSPALWAMLAWARRQYGQSQANDSIQAAAVTTTNSQRLGQPTTAVPETTSAAGITSSNVASPDDVIDAHDPQNPPDQSTGVITGSVDVSNPQNKPLTFTLTGTPPASGSVVLNASSGAFTYTPTQAARLAAGSTPGADFDSFTVNVSDGQATTSVIVSVAVLPAVISGPTSAATGAGPMGVAVSPTKTYVANQYSGTVSVIDRSTGTVSTINNVVNTPTAIALSPDFSRAYVAGNGAVAVIDTSNSQVIRTIQTNAGQIYGVAVSPNGQLVYVTNSGGNSVSVINPTAQNPVMATVGVGVTPTGIAVSADGTRVYVTNWNSNSVSVINTATNQVVGNPIAVGANPFGIAISPDGTKLYTANYGSGTVSVITNPATSPQVSSVTVGQNPFGLAISPDGSLVYAANANDTLSFINTKTNTVVRTVTIDNQPEYQWHSIGVSPDGRQIYTSDLADNQVRTLTVNRGNTPPLPGSPTIGTPDANTGAVTGALGFNDTDGDAMTFSVQSQPAGGTVTFNNMAGTYTFTPTQAARDLAAQTQGPDFVSFTVIASDGQATTSEAVNNVPISPTPQGNRAPVAGVPSVGTPDRATGTLTGSLNFTDPDGNSLTYNVPMQPSAGTVTTFANGTYSFTPTQAAMDAAFASPGPDSASVTVTANDGQFTTPVTFNVPIQPTNHAPVAGVPSVGTPVTATGAVSGDLNFTDPNGDPLTFSVPTQPSAGTVTVNNAARTYTFTPNQAARDAAAAGGPTSTSITVNASDGLASTSVTFSVPISPTPAVNQAPTAMPTQQAPNQTTGAISGLINGVDPEGSTVSYALVGTLPANGSVTLNSMTGAFTYTPTQAARLAAGTTAGADFDAFTVNVSDGQATTPVTVSVAMLPAVISGPSSSQVGAGPMGVAVSPTKTYVANQYAGSLSVIDRSTGVVSTINNVVPSPRAVALSPDGSRLYVGGSSAVSVINTATNAVIATVATNGGQVNGIAFSPNGQRAYVANQDANTVSVVNTTTATPTVIATVAVGQNTPTGIAVSPDGTRVYVANWNSGTVRVINTATNQVTGNPIAVGANPYAVAVSPDGSKLYVANFGSGTVSVIANPATAPQVSSIAVGPNPFGIAISPDGSLAYAGNANDTVSVINTKTNAVVSTVTIDTPGYNWHNVAVSPDGRQIYVSDLADGQVRTLTFNRGNTPPLAGAPTIGTPDANTGAVTGALNFKDTDGDALSYSVAAQPATGTVTFNNAAGTYTFTPSSAARDAAANGGPTTTSFTVVASDGQASASVAVQNVPIGLKPIAQTTSGLTVGTGPSGSAVVGNHLYVINSGSNNVSVVDTTTKSVVKTISVGTMPLSVAGSPTTNRVYVTNGSDNTLSVIDTTTDTVAATITIPVQDGFNPESGAYQNVLTEVAVSSDGSLVYTTASDGTMTVINGANNQIITTTSTGFYRDLKTSVNDSVGLIAYGTHGAYVDAIFDSVGGPSPYTVQVGPTWDLDATTSEFTDSTSNIAVSPDGTRVFVTYEVTQVQRGVGGQTNGEFIVDSRGNNWLVTGRYTAVSVIDTNPNDLASYLFEIAEIRVPAGAQDIALSPDGSRAYVTSYDGKTVSVINTDAESVMGSFTTDQSSAQARDISIGGDTFPFFTRYVTVAPNGMLYVTDYTDNKVYVVTIGNPQM